jgi:hypothetical protein
MAQSKTFMVISFDSMRGGSLINCIIFYQYYSGLNAGVHLGFVTPPALFFLIQVAMLLACLLTVKGMKRLFFGRFAVE